MSYPPPPPPGQDGPGGSGDQYGSGGGYGAPPPPPGYGGPQYGGHPAPQGNQKALWSLILGIVGLVCCGLFTGIPALILGNSAKKEIAASGGAQTGEGMAKAGVILGIIAIVWGLLALVLFGAGILALPSTSTSP